MITQTNPGRELARGEGWRKLWSMVKDIKTAMMTSIDGGLLRSRPMVGHIEEGEGTIWFFTRASSHKADEIERDNQINLAYAEPDKQEYVSISGRARLVRDKARIDALWNPFVAAWFPQGKDDPDVALIRVEVEQAEYWDGSSSRMVQLWKVAQANLTGREPDMGENRKL
jgi:general stress protein 26